MSLTIGLPGHPAIVVWPFKDAPPILQKYSTHGGDEDGIVWIPDQFIKNEDSYGPYWLEKLWRDYGDPEFIRFTNGVLVIWAHT